MEEELGLGSKKFENMVQKLCFVVVKATYNKALI
jgi:hypothetical protein